VDDREERVVSLTALWEESRGSSTPTRASMERRTEIWTLGRLHSRKKGPPRTRDCMAPAAQPALGDWLPNTRSCREAAGDWRPGRVYFLTFLNPYGDNRTLALTARSASLSPR